MSSEQDRRWERGWAGHERAQLKRLASLPLDEKLRWLEEAHALVRHLRHGDRGKERVVKPLR